MYIFTKRTIDILISLTILFALSPLLLVIMILLLTTGEHQIFFTQERVGYKNKKFKIYKFITMKRYRPGAQLDDVKLNDALRITRVGKFLRAAKIDELPQLFNVLLGQMSIVGPRPLLERDFKLYPEAVKKIIYKTRPGLTGIGSVYFRDEEKLIYLSGIDFTEYFREEILPFKGSLEIWYNKNRSLKVDFTLILLTIWVLFFPNIKLQQKILKELPAEKEHKVSWIENDFI